MGKSKGRSLADTGPGNGQHFPVHEYVLASPAYRLLPPRSRALLIEMMRFANRDKGVSGRVRLSVRQAAEAIGTNKNTAAAAICDLTERGFIDQVERAGFNQKAAAGSVYRLTWCGPPEGRTKRFLEWQPSAEQEKSRSQKTGPTGLKNRDRDAKPVPKIGTPGLKNRDCEWPLTGAAGPENRDITRSSHGRAGFPSGSRLAKQRGPDAEIVAERRRRLVEHLAAAPPREQNEIANLAGTTQASVSRLAAGKSAGRPATWDAIERAVLRRQAELAATGTMAEAV